MNGAALLDHTVEGANALVDDIVSPAQLGSPAAFAELHSIYSGRLYKTILSVGSKNPPSKEPSVWSTIPSFRKSVEYAILMPTGWQDLRSYRSEHWHQCNY